ncbi:hypothetical protein ACQJBY_056423 [Aegilops geniculata]
MARVRCPRDPDGAPARGLADLSTCTEFEDDGTDKLDIVDRCINSLHEKRRSTREAGMEGLVGLLEGFIPMDKIDYRCLTIFFRCRASLNTGSTREALLAYRAIGLLALTVGDNADCSKEILTSTLQLPTLMKTLQATSDDTKVVAALNCLAIVTFAAARRPEDVEPSIRAIWGVIKSSRADNRTDPVVLITALSAWALLLTTLGDLRTYPYAWKEATIPFHDLAELLDTDDPALLMASGEALAVCAELNLMQHATPEDMETLEIKVSDLASGTHGNDKKLTGQIRVMFQQIAAIMKRGQCSDEELIPTTWRQRRVLMVSKWARLVQLNFVKRFLGKCFDKHIHDNPLFRGSSFSNVATNETSDLPIKKSKQHKFGREKQYTVSLKRDRMISWESKNDFLLI